MKTGRTGANLLNRLTTITMKYLLWTSMMIQWAFLGSGIGSSLSASVPFLPPNWCKWQWWSSWLREQKDSKSAAMTSITSYDWHMEELGELKWVAIGVITGPDLNIVVVTFPVMACSKIKVFTSPDQQGAKNRRLTAFYCFTPATGTTGRII